MEYHFWGLLGILVLMLVMHYTNKKQRKKRLEIVRAQWAIPKEEPFDFDLISEYANTVKCNPFHRLTEQTKTDIDFHKLFAFIDRTTSKIGQQHLYKKLLEPINSNINPSDNFINLFTSNQALREEIQILLTKLSNNEAYAIPFLLKENPFNKPKWIKLIFLDIIILVSFMILSFKFPALIIALIILALFNVFFQDWNKKNTFQLAKSLPELNNLINVAKGLQKMGGPFVNPTVQDSIKSLRSFQHKAYLISLGNKTGIEPEISRLGSYLMELIKGIFLIDVIAMYWLMEALVHKKGSIQQLFDYVGNIDSSISVASLRAGKIKTCIPSFISQSKKIQVKGIFHPLIEDCVKNDLLINGKSILLTGSNMSGKSTFLRTLTINSLLAQTIYTCFADEFKSPILKQFSSIKINDNLFESRSYYFQEVITMASLLEQVEKPHQNLFIIDEVFKGTNTIERISAAKAILSYLNRNEHIVVVSTHDIELVEMLKNEYDLYHFTETIEENQLHFDYSIKIGELKTRNAIKILELSNYPIEVITEAHNVSTKLNTSKMQENEPPPAE